MKINKKIIPDYKRKRNKEIKRKPSINYEFFFNNTNFIHILQPFTATAVDGHFLDLVFFLNLIEHMIAFN